MTETTTDPTEGPQVTVGFKRKVALPKRYESAEASIYITGTLDDFSRVEQSELVEITRDLFFAGKSGVYEQLGITFDVTQDMVVRERLEEAGLSAVEVTRADEALAVAQATTHVHENEAPVPPKPATGDEQWRELASRPELYFDQRSTKSGRQPDFKRKGTGDGLWLGSKSNPVPSDVTIPSDGFATR